jgi:hypothetical protein
MSSPTPKIVRVHLSEKHIREDERHINADDGFPSTFAGSVPLSHPLKPLMDCPVSPLYHVCCLASTPCDRGSGDCRAGGYAGLAWTLPRSLPRPLGCVLFNHVLYLNNQLPILGKPLQTVPSFLSNALSSIYAKQAQCMCFFYDKGYNILPCRQTEPMHDNDASVIGSQSAEHMRTPARTLF